MNKADMLLKAMGGAIHESASHRGTPAAMPGPVGAAAATPDRMAGVARSKVALEIPHGKIEPDPDQPREEFDDEALGRLADSIGTKGQLQPIAVRWVACRGHRVLPAGGASAGPEREPRKRRWISPASLSIVAT